ncbi:MAG: carbohydrate kinase family protein [Anaerolineales bacterium]|nr:carbohydrate kinase family protein [Anaerolineales bacterium]
MEHALPRFLIAGQLTRDYMVFPSGEALLDVPGGNALYAAVGLAIWEPEPPPAIIARVGEDYPQEWLDDLSQRGLDMRAVHILPQAVDLRSFTAFLDRTTRAYDDPVAHFARLGLPFPKSLLGYRPTTGSLDSRTRMAVTSLRQGDIPSEFMDASVAHFCPVDYLTHSLLPAMLRQAQFTTITLDPSPGYMNPSYWDDVPALLTGLTAFMPSETEIRALFHSRSQDLWEMAAALSAYGCDIVVIKCGEHGQLLYDHASRTRWEIPAYPARLVNPVGAGDAFCGGFLAGYRRTYDPLQAVLYGNISASLVVEGHPPLFALDVLPGLPEARKEALRQTVRKV